MSKADDSRLYGLMEIAEGQQAAVQAALEGLAAERAALRREREALARQVQALEQGTRAAVRAAVTDSLAGAATEGAAAVQAATRPLLDRVAGVTAEAGQAEAALRGVVLWASWRLLGWIVAVGAATVLLGWLMSSAVLWWDTGAIADAQVRRAQLRAEVAELQANYDGWVKAGVLEKVIRCNPGNRPCIRVNESAGAFESQGHNDYRVIQGTSGDGWAWPGVSGSWRGCCCGTWQRRCCRGAWGTGSRRRWPSDREGAWNCHLRQKLTLSALWTLSRSGHPLCLLIFHRSACLPDDAVKPDFLGSGAGTFDKSLIL